MDVVVGPVFQVYVVAPDAVIIPLCPAHTVALAIVIVGFAFTVNVALADEVQVPFDPITEYVVVKACVTETLCVVAPVLQV